jgi:hypothetical protein
MEARSLILEAALGAQANLEARIFSGARMGRCQNTEALRDYDFAQSQPESVEVINSRAMDRQRVINLANLLVSGGDFFNGNERWNMEDVTSELASHVLLPNCLAQLMAGKPEQLKDLTLRVARHLAASILKIDADEIGVVV